MTVHNTCLAEGFTGSIFWGVSVNSFIEGRSKAVIDIVSACIKEQANDCDFDEVLPKEIAAQLEELCPGGVHITITPAGEGGGINWFANFVIGMPVCWETGNDIIKIDKPTPEMVYQLRQLVEYLGGEVAMGGWCVGIVNTNALI